MASGNWHHLMPAGWPEADASVIRTPQVGDDIISSAAYRWA